MIIDVCLIGHEWIVLKSSLHGLDALLVLLKGKVSETQLVKHLSISFIGVKSSIQVIYWSLIQAHVIVTLSSVLEEFYFLGLQLDSLFKVVDSKLKIAHHVVALAQSVQTVGVLLSLHTAFKILSGLPHKSRFQFRDSQVKVRQRVVLTQLYGLFKVLNGILVVAHVLIHQPPLNVNSFVISKVHLNIGKLSESLMESLGSPVHQSKMEHRWNECLAILQCLVELLNS